MITKTLNVVKNTINTIKNKKIVEFFNSKMEDVIIPLKDIELYADFLSRGGIYLIFNIDNPNLYLYIGKAINIYVRWVSGICEVEKSHFHYIKNPLDDGISNLKRKFYMDMHDDLEKWMLKPIFIEDIQLQTACEKFLIVNLEPKYNTAHLRTPGTLNLLKREDLINKSKESESIILEHLGNIPFDTSTALNLNIEDNTKNDSEIIEESYTVKNDKENSVQRDNSNYLIERMKGNNVKFQNSPKDMKTHMTNGYVVVIPSKRGNYPRIAIPNTLLDEMRKDENFGNYLIDDSKNCRGTYYKINDKCKNVDCFRYIDGFMKNDSLFIISDGCRLKSSFKNYKTKHGYKIEKIVGT